MNSVLAAVAVALLAALAAAGILAGEDEAAEPAPSSGPSAERVAGRVEEVARGVERVRELEFDRMPRVRLVSPAEARRAGLAELDRQVPLRRQRTEERLLELLGLLPPDARLRDLVGTALTGEVAGYYIPRSDTLALVRGAGLGGLLAEVALAHELTHALEDQRFGIEPHGASGFLRDRSVAESALHEGTATLVMVDYVALSQGLGRQLPADLRRRVLDELRGVALPASSGLPRYVREGLVFPYAAGARFVNRIQGRGGWAAVDRAFGRDAPVSSEQLIHPGKYEAGERPVRVRLGGYRAELPEGARVAARGDLGEFDTAQFLRDGNGRRRSEEAAAGWGGSTFELWRLPGGGDVLAMGWAWDTPSGTPSEFAAAARATVGRLGSPGVVNDGDEGVVAVVLAPEVRRWHAGWRAGPWTEGVGSFTPRMRAQATHARRSTAKAVAPQRRLHRSHRLLDARRIRRVELSAQRRVGRLPDRARATRGAPPPRRQLRDQRLERHPRLQRGLARAPRLQVGAGAQHELLADERLLARSQERGKALLGRLHRALHPSRPLREAVPAPPRSGPPPPPRRGRIRPAPPAPARPTPRPATGPPWPPCGRAGRGSECAPPRPPRPRRRPRRGAALPATPTPPGATRTVPGARRSPWRSAPARDRRRRPAVHGARRTAAARARPACRARAPPRAARQACVRTM